MPECADVPRDYLVAVWTFRPVPIHSPAAPRSSTATPSSWLVRLHGIDAPELDQPFWWRGQQLVGGMMALAEVLTVQSGRARPVSVPPTRTKRFGSLQHWRDRASLG